MNKTNVGILYGGRSQEHDISILSADSILSNLDRSRFEPIPIGISRAGVWLLNNQNRLLTADALACLEHDTAAHLFPIIGPTKLSESQRSAIDVIFPAIHGVNCEDGKVQGLLETLNLPYVGSGVLGSAIAMDKDISKKLARLDNIPVGPYVAITARDWHHHRAALLARITSTLTFPVFVKPANTGSSIGIEKIRDTSNLSDAISRAFRLDQKILIEQGIFGHEVEVAVLESLSPHEDPIASVAGEICTTHDFYSYQAKYEDPDSLTLVIPARIPDTLAAAIQQAAKTIFHVLHCQGMARIDFFVDDKKEHFYFNEANTIPGFTTLSMYPKLMEASGITYTELLTHLIELAQARHCSKSVLPA